MLILAQLYDWENVTKFVLATERTFHHPTATNANGNARNYYTDRRIGFRDAIDVHSHHLRDGMHDRFILK